LPTADSQPLFPLRVILSVTNDLSGDQRLHRICTTLHEAGHDVLLVGRKLPGSRAVQRVYRTRRMRLLFTKGPFFYAEYALRLALLLLFRKADALTANDLDTLLPNFIVARIRGLRLYYDTHEYFTEVPELIHRPRVRAVWLALEKMLFPRVAVVYTVNESLAKIYSRLYGLPVAAVRNVPVRATQAHTATAAKPAPARGRILLYQGALNVGRGVELMIRAMAYLSDEYVLWVIGRGDVEQSLHALVASLGLAQKVTMMGFVPLEALPALTHQATLGFSLEEDLGANYRLASPNKVYDYIQAGVPVLVSDLPEMRLTVETHGVGELLYADERTPEALAARARALCESTDSYTAYVANCHAAAAALCWEQEKERLLQLYR